MSFLKTFPKFDFCNFKKNFWIPLLLATLSYFTIFYPLFGSDTVIYSGKDSVNLHYPSRYYLHERLSNLEFPVWTERVFSGFPIYADIERGYLNPINVVSVVLFGPFRSYKVLHFHILFVWVYGAVFVFALQGLYLTWIFCCKLHLFLLVFSSISSTTL